MSDAPDNLETELQSMRPASLSADFASRIGVAIRDDSPSPWAERRLLGAIWAGAVAGCVIVTMLMMPNGSPAIPGARLNVSSNKTNADSPTVAVALADPRWIDLIK
jgi:hypothetical protein